MAMAQLADPELLDPHPDILALFLHYNALYFDDALGACIVSWSSSRMTSCAGTCHYLQGGGCEIRLSQPLLKYRTTSDLKNTLLHEMIHAFLWIMSKNKDHSDHGPTFRAIMNTINLSTVTDHQRPSDGYNITVYHEFHKEVDSYRVHQWTCDLCGDLIKRAMNREPSANDCIEHRGRDNSCGNLLCHWHGYKMRCSGKYIKIAEPPGYKGKKRAAKGACENDESEFDGPSHGTKKSSGRMQGVENSKGSHDVQKLKEITKFYQPLGDVDPGIKALSGNDRGLPSSNKNKQLKIMEVKSEGHSSGVKTPTKERTPACRKQCKNPCTEKNKSRKRTREVTAAIPLLGYYEDDESEEDVEPLVNKRSERRKKERECRKLKGKCLDADASNSSYPSKKSSPTLSLLEPGVTLKDRSKAPNSCVEDYVVFILDDE